MSVASNNRFLMKTNPQITRALADSGSSLNHPEIQRLARQQVDLGLWGNLKLWVHRDLVKTRTSGSDLFVPKAYDMSGNNNDAAQTTEAYQPKLVSTGMEFDGSNDVLIRDYLSTIHHNVAWSFMCRFNVGVLKDTGTTADWQNIMSFSGSSSNRGGVAIRYDSVNGAIYNGSGWVGQARSQTISINTHYFVVYTYDGSNNGYIYLNSVVNTLTNVGTSSTTTGLRFGARTDNSQYFQGTLNDIRIYNTALTADQISAIYNETKSYYGL